MRLYNYYYLCKEWKTRIESIGFRESHRKENEYMIDGVEVCKETLLEVRKIPELQKQADIVYGALSTMTRRVKLSLENKMSIEKEIHVLLEKMDVVISLANKNQHEKNGLGIDVSMPKCNGLKEYIGYLRDMDFLFNQCPYLTKDEVRIEFSGTDVGSWWVVFSVLGAAAAGIEVLKKLAELVDCAIRIKSHYISVKQQEQLLEQMEMENEKKRIYSDVLNSMTKTILQQETDKLSQRDLINDPEEYDKLVKGIEKIVNLLNNGGGIHTSIDAPKEVQVLFPPVESSNGITESILKLIEDKGEASE